MSHAGFAAVIAVDQAFLQNTLRVEWLANAIPHTIQETVGVPGVLEFVFDLFSDCPELRLSAEEPQALLIRIDAWGTLAAPPTAPEARTIRLTAAMRVPHEGSFNEEGQLQVTMRAAEATLDFHTIEILQGDDFPGPVAAVMDSDIFAEQLEGAMRNSLEQAANRLPAIDMAFLRQFLGTVDPELDAPVEREATTRSLNGVLAIGIDLHQGGMGTVGHPDEMDDITGGMAVGVAANPWIWVPNLRHRVVEGGLRKAVESQGASLDSFGLTPGSGSIHAGGRASRGSNSVEFSMDLVPRLGRPAQWVDLGPDQVDPWPCIVYVPPVDELWFEPHNVHVSVSESFWYGVLEAVAAVLTTGLALFVVQSMKDLIQANVQGAMSSQAGRLSTGLEFAFAQGGGAPPIVARLERFRFAPDNMDMGLSIDTRFPKLTHQHNTTYDAGDIQRGFLPTLNVALPETVHPQDPYVRVAWTIRHKQTNEIIQTLDDVAEVAMVITVSVPPDGPDLTVRCRVYRALAGTITELHWWRGELRCSDLLDRSHPFVHWAHYVWTPKVVTDANGRGTVIGGSVKYRRSRLHRTDLEGRCKFASRFSIDNPDGFEVPQDPGRPVGLFYLDDLPFPYADLDQHRGSLCDYCFYGGPSGTQRLPLPRRGPAPT